jgi:hydrogenase 3 maturation protease
VQTLSRQLQQKLENAVRVVVLGVGSELRGDDIAGILAAGQIEKICLNKPTLSHIHVIIGETAPENFTGEIKKIQPTHLVVIDSADFGGKAGQIAVIEPGNIGGVTFCTHSLPMKVMTDYLLGFFQYEVIFIGIQPKTLEAGVSPSKEIRQAAKQVSAVITKLLEKS